MNSPLLARNTKTIAITNCKKRDKQTKVKRTMFNAFQTWLDCPVTISCFI
jgi:hypothetical protein